MLKMSDFNAFFDEWAASYDATVYGSDNEYIEVFQNYEGIFESIITSLHTQNANNVIEVGPGTGNLTAKLLSAGFKVVGIEPSSEMRKLASEKLPEVLFLEGHFLDFPELNPADAIVSSYAFHHLTLDEKRQSIDLMKGLLNKKGTLVIADTMFESAAYKSELLQAVEADGALNLLNDLNTEYYEMLEDMVAILEEAQFSVRKEKMNRYVWVLTASLN